LHEFQSKKWGSGGRVPLSKKWGTPSFRVPAPLHPWYAVAPICTRASPTPVQDHYPPSNAARCRQLCDLHINSMTNTLFFKFQIISFEKYFCVSLGNIFYRFCGGPLVVETPGQLPSLSPAPPVRRYASAGTSYGPISVSVCYKKVFYQKG